MLILSRKKNETIVIQFCEVLVRVMVVEIRGDKVRLGCDGPAEVTIHRQEVFDAIARNDGQELVRPESVRESPTLHAQRLRRHAESLLAKAKLLEQEG